MTWLEVGRNNNNKSNLNGSRFCSVSGQTSANQLYHIITSSPLPIVRKSWNDLDCVTRQMCSLRVKILKEYVFWYVIWKLSKVKTTLNSRSFRSHVQNVSHPALFTKEWYITMISQTLCRSGSAYHSVKVLWVWQIETICQKLFFFYCCAKNFFLYSF